MKVVGVEGFTWIQVNYYIPLFPVLNLFSGFVYILFCSSNIEIVSFYIVTLNDQLRRICHKCNEGRKVQTSIGKNNIGMDVMIEEHGISPWSCSDIWRLSRNEQVRLNPKRGKNCLPVCSYDLCLWYNYSKNYLTIFHDTLGK